MHRLFVLIALGLTACPEPDHPASHGPTCPGGQCGQIGDNNGASQQPSPSDCEAGELLEGCPCDPESRARCYEGPEGTAGVGICLRGVRECVAGRWGGCTGQRLPEAQETCNQTDDDCDGDIDEGFPQGCSSQSQPGEPVARGPAHGQAFEEPAANSGLERDDDGNIVLVPGEAGEQLTTNSLWIANAGEGTVSKVDTDLLREVARYPSIGPNRAGLTPHADQSPSRTAIDLAGNAFVANRNFEGQGSVTKYADTQCIDRNGNGRIETSSDRNGNGSIDVDDPTEYLGMEDECILWTLPVGGQAGIPRALAIDGGDAQNPNGNLWVGLFNERRFYNLQGETGELVRRPGQTNPVDIGHQPYGAVIDSQGVVWSTSLGAGVMPPSTLVGVDSTTGRAGDTIQSPWGGSYGIAADARGRLWVGGFFGQRLTSYDPNFDDQGNAVADPLQGGGHWRSAPVQWMIRGVAADNQGRIWAATNEGGSVAAWDADSMDFISNHSVGGSATVGVGVDFTGRIWGVSGGGDLASRVDPDNGGPMVRVRVGQSPYTYSDFTGFALRNFTLPRGSYRTIVQGCSKRQTSWQSFDAVTTTPPGTRIRFRIRVAATEAELAQAPAYGPFEVSSEHSDLPALLLDLPTVSTAMIEAELSSDDPETSPILRGFDLYFDCNG